MAIDHTTRLLLRDELVGFARSRVMLVLWVVLPIAATIGYAVVPGDLVGSRGSDGMTATAFMSMLMSSIAGLVAAMMTAVDLVTERNRRVYDLLLVRPIRREAIVWAKFFAVFTSVTMACVVSLAFGLLIDTARGDPPAAATVPQLVKSVMTLIVVIAMSTGVGASLGVAARTPLLAVILVLYVGQWFTIIPMLPSYLGVGADWFWAVMLVSVGIAAGLVVSAGGYFARNESSRSG